MRIAIGATTEENNGVVSTRCPQGPGVWAVWVRVGGASPAKQGRTNYRSGNAP